MELSAVATMKARRPQHFGPNLDHIDEVFGRKYHASQPADRAEATVEHQMGSKRHTENTRNGLAAAAPGDKNYNRTTYEPGFFQNYGDGTQPRTQWPTDLRRPGPPYPKALNRRGISMADGPSWMNTAKVKPGSGAYEYMRLPDRSWVTTERMLKPGTPIRLDANTYNGVPEGMVHYFDGAPDVYYPVKALGRDVLPAGPYIKLDDLVFSRSKIFRQKTCPVKESGTRDRNLGPVRSEQRRANALQKQKKRNDVPSVSSHMDYGDRRDAEDRVSRILSSVDLPAGAFQKSLLSSGMATGQMELTVERVGEEGGEPKIKCDGLTYAVRWINTPSSTHDTPVKLTAVDPAVHGICVLSDGSRFKNPRASVDDSVDSDDEDNSEALATRISSTGRLNVSGCVGGGAGWAAAVNGIYALTEVEAVGAWDKEAPKGTSFVWDHTEEDLSLYRHASGYWLVGSKENARAGSATGLVSVHPPAWLRVELYSPEHLLNLNGKWFVNSLPAADEEAAAAAAAVGRKEPLRGDPQPGIRISPLTDKQLEDYYAASASAAE